MNINMNPRTGPVCRLAVGKIRKMNRRGVLSEGENPGAYRFPKPK